MKTLYLIRHAKSDWSDGSRSDFDRSLNDRGKRDAPMMAKRLLTRNITIDTFISSSAMRAQKTAIAFAEIMKTPITEITFHQELYLAYESVFEKIIADIPDHFKSAAIFSHNPGITAYANTLCKTQIDNIPTCGIFSVAANCDYWKDFAKAKKDFLFADYPKAIE